MTTRKQEFYSQLKPGGCFEPLFNHISDTYFFVKDRESRLISGNEKLARQLGCPSVDSLTGASDFDFFPKSVAMHYREDDEKIFQTGKAIVNRLEPWKSDRGGFCWFSTTKMPIYNKSDQICGIAGVTAPHFSHPPANLPHSVAKAIEYLTENYQEKISIETLAAQSSVSTKQLNRLFQKVCGMSAREFLTRTRILHSSDRLADTKIPISVIANESGFIDQSYFTRTFQKYLGCSPSEFRRNNSLFSDS